MREVTVREEPWSDALWAEIKPHAEAHAVEVDGGVEPRRPFKLDVRLMHTLAQAGVLHLVIARKLGVLIGYFTWQISLDVECFGLLIAQQGAWYVDPGHPIIAARMFDVSIKMLRDLGVRCIFPHHRTQGRGANIGRFFERRGAKHTQNTYTLWIGE